MSFYTYLVNEKAWYLGPGCLQSAITRMIPFHSESTQVDGLAGMISASSANMEIFKTQTQLLCLYYTMVCLIGMQCFMW